MPRTLKSSRKHKGSAKSVCDSQPQPSEQCGENALKVEDTFISEQYESKPCNEGNSAGSSVPEGTKTLVCGYCGKQFSDKFHFRRHLRELHHPNLNLTCKECGKVSNNSDALYQHMKTHLPHCLECAECGNKFRMKRNLALHWHKIHGDRTKLPAEVRLKPKSPKSSSSSAQVLLKCRDCDKTYKSATGLSRHRTSVHLQKHPHTCTTCGQVFAQKSSLQRHQEVHIKGRPFQCEHCVASFRDKWHLTQHERIHTGVQPYVCNICEEAFTLKVLLHEHNREYHECLKRKCPECHYTCQTYGALASHWKVKHASQWVHKNPSKGHSSVLCNEESPSLSVDWRNKHAIIWANPSTRRKRERINIALLEALARIASSKESDDSMNIDSEELATCDNESTSQTGPLSQGICGNDFFLNLSSLASSSDEEATQAHVPSTAKANIKIVEREETAHVFGGHYKKKVNGVLKSKKSVVLQMAAKKT